MPLGAEHVQAAHADDFLVLLGHRPPGLFHCLRPRRLEILRRLDRGQPALVQLQVGDEVRVTAEHDVGAAACRSWYFAFSTSCGTPWRLSILETISDFSTLVVPTSTGWPARCRSTMSSTHAWNLAWTV